uniref:Uncharacterized protein n=1 Tax=Rhizophora mucronata TaxID=61149 RepID=A0A2P2QY99_RHIMU
MAKCSDSVFRLKGMSNCCMKRYCTFVPKGEQN